MELETVRVVSPVSDENPHGYVIINASDLTEDHVVFEDSAEPAPKPLKPGKAAKGTPPDAPALPEAEGEAAPGLSDNTE